MAWAQLGAEVEATFAPLGQCFDVAAIDPHHRGYEAAYRIVDPWRTARRRAPVTPAPRVPRTPGAGVHARLEHARVQALAMLAGGHNQRDTCLALGLHRGTLVRWVAAARLALEKESTPDANSPGA